jgi:hypothetical protein
VKREGKGNKWITNRKRERNRDEELDNHEFA